ncbi:MAG: Flp1 family type IVb pilin [Pseudobdellovibrionaceae bacterium]|jgi:hypothetical protein
MQKVKSFFKTLWSDESGQGTAEYVLLIAIVVALAFAFRGRITDAINARMSDIEGTMGGFSTQ